MSINDDGEWDKSDDPNSTLVLESATASSGETVAVAFGYYGIRPID